MAEKNVQVNQRVEVIGKGVRAKVAYVGMTSFAAGKWVGLILDEPKGKNNGSIKGKSYFTCADNYGMFVRPTQIVLLDDAGNPIEETTEERLPRSRLSSAGSIRSLSGITKPTASRLSLSSSRQSLLGSRSLLVSPATEKPQTGGAGATASAAKAAGTGADKKTISPPEALSKRASFIETGFLETLKPQFTPGQSLISPSPAVPSAEDKLKELQHQQEIDDLKSQIRDLTEKLEASKLKRAEDKERLREYDRMRTQYEQLQEFKTKIMEAQTQLQRELQRARQETKDAIEARDRHMEEMSELSENVELITLDKEMAEEKAETLQIELDCARERIEELSLDLEILKTEMQNKTGEKIGNTRGGEVNTTFEFKQLEQQNIRLRETLVRLRDLSAHDKHEISKSNKELEMKKSEVAELQRTKEKLSSKIDELESTLFDLQEQVDAALGAEEMVEQLAEKKMELEDKVKILEEEVSELEALNDVQEQLIESNRDLEMDLREELDLVLAAKREMLREKEAALETIVDRDQTILKFRELVNKLNEQMLEMRERVDQKDTSKQVTKDTIIADTIDFKQMFAESKAYTRAIDLQLRQIELTQANEHVHMLSAYMPETFMCRGGDHDAILVILLVSRIVFKSGIIVNQARERFAAVSSIDKTTILQGHAVHQFAFKSRLLHHIHNLQRVMHQFLYGLNTCTPDNLLKVGASLPEMVAQEKIIDGVIELLKANQLDENSPTENLEKCIAFFNAMHSVLLNADKLMNETQMIRDCVASATCACDSISTDACTIQALITGGDETSDSGLLMQYTIQNVDNIRQQLKLIKRRLPQDPHVIKSGLSLNTIQNLRNINEQLGRIMAVLFLTAKQVVQNASVESGEETSISHTKLWDILSNMCERIYEQDDRGPSNNIRNILSSTNTDLTQVAQYLLDHEYEIISATNSKNEKIVSPIVLRAQFVKKQLEETKTLTAILENREAEIKQLKLTIKMKQSELSEMQIRKDLAEKKLSVLQHDYEAETQRLQRQSDEVTKLLKSREKEFEETMDHLQMDIDALENERGTLREKLKSLSSKKGIDLKSSTAFDITAGSPYIVQELALLKRAFNEERTERLRLQASELKAKLSKLEPIFVPKPKDNRIIELEKDLAKVKHDWLISLIQCSQFPERKTQHGNIQKIIQDHQNKVTVLRDEIKMKAGYIVEEVLQEYLQRNPHRSAEGDFRKFCSVELSNAFKATK